MNNNNIWIVIHHELWDMLPNEAKGDDWVVVAEEWAKRLNYKGKVWDVVYGAKGLALLDEQMLKIMGRKSYFTTPAPRGNVDPAPKQEKTVIKIGKYEVKI